MCFLMVKGKREYCFDVWQHHLQLNCMELTVLLIYKFCFQIARRYKLIAFLMYFLKFQIYFHFLLLKKVY